MAYVSLYRRYRPQRFSEIVGQDHVTTTLARAVDEGRNHHAYLFTGPRGTGKTSTARILAMALNASGGPTSDPPADDPLCEAIARGACVDVLEIDAASHGGVDDVRDLRDRVSFAPAQARTKVYIVDECHMLSTAGWNAFLKTVEEPPGHVVFVFATTEPHKVLPTILSRTQRFDFRRVPGKVLGAHCEQIAAREGWTFAPGALELIVRAGDGSVRDTLSVLEQVVAFTGPNVTLEGVADVLGTVPASVLAELVDGLAEGDVAAVLGLVGRVADAGQDLRQFAQDAVEHLRCLLLLRAAPDAGLVETTPERLAALVAQASAMGPHDLLRAVELLNDSQVQMRRGNTRLPLEIALAKATLPGADDAPEALRARLERLEHATPDPRPPDPGLPDPSSSPADPSPAPAAEVAGVPPAAAGPSPTDPGPPDPSASPAAEDAGVPRAAADPGLPDPSSSPADPSASPAAKVAGSPPDAAGGHAAPSPAPAGVDLDAVRAVWPSILATAGVRSKKLEATLGQGQAAAMADGLLTIEFPYEFHASYCGTEPAREAIGEVLAAVLGQPLRIVCRVAGAPAPVETAESARSRAEESAVREAEAAEAAGDLPDPRAAHDQAVETLTRTLGAQIVSDERG